MNGHLIVKNDYINEVINHLVKKGYTERQAVGLLKKYHNSVRSSFGYNQDSSYFADRLLEVDNFMKPILRKRPEVKQDHTYVVTVIGHHIKRHVRNGHIVRSHVRMESRRYSKSTVSKY